MIIVDAKKEYKTEQGHPAYVIENGIVCYDTIPDNNEELIKFFKNPAKYKTDHLEDYQKAGIKVADYCNILKGMLIEFKGLDNE